MEMLDKCLVCSGSNFSPFLTCKDYTVSGQLFKIVQCTNCSFTFTNPRPNSQESIAYYKSDSYVSHTNTKKGLINKIYHLVRSFTLKSKLTIINKLTLDKTKILLDIGCGTGYFLEKANNNAWQTIGVEVDDDARKMAIERTNKNIFNTLAAIENTNSIDVITMWHVLEHVHTLNEYLEKFKQIIKKDGSIVIAVPNLKSYDAIKYAEYWSALDVPRHLYHFDLDSITKLFAKHNFYLYDTKGMFFDSFYVSMLSEKYKNGKGNLIAAFFTGLISNLKAKKNNFSSRIYVFKNL